MSNEVRHPEHIDDRKPSTSSGRRPSSPKTVIREPSEELKYGITTRHLSRRISEMHGLAQTEKAHSNTRFLKGTTMPNSSARKMSNESGASIMTDAEAMKKKLLKKLAKSGDEDTVIEDEPRAKRTSRKINWEELKEDQRKTFLTEEPEVTDGLDRRRATVQYDMIKRAIGGIPLLHGEGVEDRRTSKMPEKKSIDDTPEKPKIFGTESLLNTAYDFTVAKPPLSAEETRRQSTVASSPVTIKQIKNQDQTTRINVDFLEADQLKMKGISKNTVAFLNSKHEKDRKNSANQNDSRTPFETGISQLVDPSAQKKYEQFLKKK